jgi:hypothetical protein
MFLDKIETGNQTNLVMGLNFPSTPHLKRSDWIFGTTNQLLGQYAILMQGSFEGGVDGVG